MSRHRIYRNYDYENDLDEYDGDSAEGDEAEGGLSPEDEVRMKEGTAEVQTALGSSAGKVTVQQIQEALWHYYYDVDKSVVYLIDKFITPTVKPKKQPEGKLSFSSLLSFGSFAHPQPLLPVVSCTPVLVVKKAYLRESTGHALVRHSPLTCVKVPLWRASG